MASASGQRPTRWYSMACRSKGCVSIEAVGMGIVPCCYSAEHRRLSRVQGRPPQFPDRISEECGEKEKRLRGTAEKGGLTPAAIVTGSSDRRAATQEEVLSITLEKEQYYVIRHFFDVRHAVGPDQPARYSHAAESDPGAVELREER